MTGKPTWATKSVPSSSVVAILLLATRWPIFSMVDLKSCLSSASCIEFMDVPRKLILYCVRTPCLYKSVAAFRAVCPPRVANIPSGFSISIIFVKLSIVKGSIYILSATSRSVIIVAGLLFTSITSMPSSLRALQAWVPE